MKYKIFGDYHIYEDGTIYSTITNRKLKPDKPHGYWQYALYVDGVPMRIKAHRLVALLFLGKPPEGKPCINHKDGNKNNNHYTNLEWCNHYENNKHARKTGLNNITVSNSKRWNDEDFRKATSRNISLGLRNSGAAAGENNPRFKYRIYDKHGNVLSRAELASLLGLSQSYTDAIIRKASQGKPIPVFLENQIKIIDISRESVTTIEKAN